MNDNQPWNHPQSIQEERTRYGSPDHEEFEKAKQSFTWGCQYRDAQDTENAKKCFEDAKQSFAKCQMQYCEHRAEEEISKLGG